MKLSTHSFELCQNAVTNVNRLKSERIEIQQTFIDLQQKQLSNVRDAVQSSMKDSVKTEISSWSYVLTRAQSQKRARRAADDRKAIGLWLEQLLERYRKEKKKLQT